MSVRHVACAVSGGVDSAVSAHLLLKQGYKVTGVYMSNWDHRDATGRSFCSSEQHERDAETICRALRIPMARVDLSAPYWTEVFEPFIAGMQAGLTPNPDVLCNRHIKFDRLLQHVKHHLGADALATGHYADTKDGRLLVPTDVYKDQTYFLAQMPAASLTNVMFPLANWLKPDVKRLAEQIGLDFLAQKKESMGICFVGKQSNFGDFLRSYMDPIDGTLVDVDTNRQIGEIAGLNYLTVGQRIPHFDHYQCGCLLRADLPSRIGYVCHGLHHPLLYSNRFTTFTAHWIRRPTALTSVAGSFECRVACQRLMPKQACTVEPLSDGRLLVTTRHPIRALRAGQLAAFYTSDKAECLGGATIAPSSQQEAENVIMNNDHALYSHAQ